MKCKYNDSGWCYAPANDETNSIGSQCIKPIECPEMARQQCSDHPGAPHGFNRSASHAEGRYVCDCEGWIPDNEEVTMAELTQQQVIDYLMGENGTFSERKAARIAAERITQQAETIEQLMRQRDGYRHEATALGIENERLEIEIDQVRMENNSLKVQFGLLND